MRRVLLPVLVVSAVAACADDPAVTDAGAAAPDVHATLDAGDVVRDAPAPDVVTDAPAPDVVMDAPDDATDAPAPDVEEIPLIPTIAHLVRRRVAVGESYSLVAATDGTLWAFGNGTSGSLGTACGAEQDTPAQVGADRDWASVSAGHSHTLALKSDGRLFGWGNGQRGANGRGRSGPGASVCPPGEVTGGGTWIDVSAGTFYSLGVRADGTLWAWGFITSGQFGNGMVVNPSPGNGVPTQVGTGTTWAMVAAGDGHALALQRDGSLWATGTNGHGQLGLGHTYDIDTWTRVGTSSSWAWIAAGMVHSAGIKTDGTLWMWGANTNGQLGLGTTDDATEPTQVGSARWTSVDCGDGATVARRRDGTAWSWGTNNYGQLGLGSIPGALTPTQVGTGSDWTELGVWVHAVALRGSTRLWTWGHSFGGSLGRGGPAQPDAPTPAQVDGRY